MSRALLIFFLGLAIIGCNSQPTTPTVTAPTIDPHFVETQVAAQVYATQTTSAIANATPTLPPTPSRTAAPSATALPTRTATPNLPRASLTQTAKLRDGPSDEYAVVTKLASGESMALNGRLKDNTWVSVRTNAGDLGWLALSALQVPQDLVASLPENSNYTHPPLPIQNWTGDPVETVCLTINRTYSDAFLKDSPTSKPMAIDSEIKMYLNGLGINTVAPGQSCDANLMIDQTIDPTGANYTAQIGNDNRYCYSGVVVESTTTLSAPGAKLESPQSQWRQNDKQITGCPLVSRDFGESYFTAAMAFREFWGDNIWGVALTSKQTDMTKYVLSELGDLGANGMRFVPAIIDFMRQPGPQSDRQIAGNTLFDITHFQYGTDVSAWELWWAQRQPTPTVSTAPTRTPILAPTLAPTRASSASASTSSPKLALPNLPLVLADNFSSNANSWQTGDDNYNDSLRNYALANGMLLWSYKTQTSLFHYDIPRKLPTVRDFSAQVQAQHLTGSFKSTYGLIFRRADSSNNYTFEIQDDQTFQVTSYINGRFDWLVRATKSTAIKPGQPNLLLVTGIGSHFEFFINGTQVAQVDNDGIAQGGIGLATSVAANDISVYQFSNFQVNGQ